MSKYLEITKSYCNHPTDYHWHLSIKDGYKNTYHCRKSNMLAKKLESIFNGETDTVKHNGVSYEMNPSPFKVRDYPIYLVYRVGEKIPCFFWYRDYPNNKENKQSSFTTDYSLIINEDIELFEKYGYVVKKFDEILEDKRKQTDLRRYIRRKGVTK